MSIGNAHVIECNGPPTAAPPFVGMHWIDTVSKTHYISVGTSDVTDWREVDLGEEVVTSITALPTLTTTVQTIALSALCRVKFQVCVYNDTQDVWRSFDLNGAKVSGGGVEHSVSAVLGDAIDFDTNFSVSGSDAIFTVTNNEVFNLTVKFRSEII